MHEKCNEMYKDAMYDSVKEHHTCLNDLGSQVTADRCYLDPTINHIRIDEKEEVLKHPSDFLHCLEDARIEKDAVFCH
jgi:hypothetical protein